MNRKTTIFLFYTVIALFGAGILTLAIWARKRIPSHEPRALPPVVDVGAGKAGDWFSIKKDLNAVNQDGQQVKLSDLRGKVWLVAEFFAVCPHCAVRNGSDLREIYETFKHHPDFHIACISVDPEADQHEKLKDYAKALGADTRNWWFLNAGEAAATHQYLEHELKFFGVRERTDPLQIEANGRYAHDLGFILVDREFNVIGKWPLADAKSEEGKKIDPTNYERLKKQLYDRINEELNKKPVPAN
jgi:protein SCO1/2